MGISSLPPRQPEAQNERAHPARSARRRWPTAVPILIGALGLSVQSACERSPTTLTLESSSFVLASVDGRPVPAVIDSTDLGGGSNRLSRIVGRSLEFLPGDSVRYARASDVVERLPDSSLREWGSECSWQQVAYRREGSRVILTIPPPPWEWPGSAVVDTLTIEGERLVQHGPIPGGRSLRFEYLPGQPSVPVCPPSPLDPVPAS